MENPITKNEEGKNKLDSTNINKSQNMNENIIEIIITWVAIWYIIQI